MAREIIETEADWQAQDDARALAQAEEIKADKPRLDKAQQAAKKMADEEAERAKAMRKVAGRKRQSSSGEGKKSTRKTARGVTQGAPGNKFNVFEKI